MSILASSDFVGDVKLNLGANQTVDFAACISRVERKILIDLLGYDLYAAFIAGLAVTPTVAAKWLGLKNGLEEFQGVKEMLKYFTYAEWINTGNFTNSVNGLSYNQAENVTTLTPGQITQLYDIAYNKGVKIYRDAADWIEEMNGPEEITSVVGTTVYTEDTKYLAAADVVLIGGEEFTVASVSNDVSFVTTVAPGNANTWQIDFYEDYENTEKDLSIFGGSL